MVQKAETSNKGKVSSKVPADLGDDWVSLETDRYIWSAENTQVPLRGYVLDCIDMPAGSLENDWRALLVRTTAPAEVKNPEGGMMTIDAGCDVLVPVTQRLNEIAKIAQHPNFVYEMQLIPKGKLELGGGKKMWRYTVHARRQPIPRENFGPMFASVAEPPQLAAGDVGSDFPAN